MSRYLTINGIEVKGIDNGKEVYCEFELQGTRHRTKTFEGVWKHTVSIGKYSRSEDMDIRCKTRKSGSRRTVAETRLNLGEFSREGEYTREVQFGKGQLVLAVFVEKKSSSRKKSSSSSSKVHRSRSEMVRKEKSRPSRLTSDGDVSAKKKAKKTAAAKVAPRQAAKRLKTPREPEPPAADGPARKRRSTASTDGPQTVELQPLAQADTEERKLFGVALEVVMARQRKSHPELEIPLFFHLAGKLIQAQGANLKGIFRIRGKLKDVKALRGKIDAGDMSDLENTEMTNIHTVCALLKAFMRELPVPVLTFEKYDEFLACADGSGDDQVAAMRDLVNSIPDANYHLVKFVIGLMSELSKKPEETQMDAENLAKVITPNLMWKETVEIMDLSLVQDAMKGNLVGKAMIENFDAVFTK
mmetsp:Transcript_1673/g.5956  ORF Transcript_1673/g.5956 Transcript_1673/m.5956 type:complete len:415 (+) Transcript_1673:336-1580(+)